MKAECSSVLNYILSCIKSVTFGHVPTVSTDGSPLVVPHTQSYRQDRGYKHYVKCSTSNCLLLFVFLQLLLENIMENTDNIILSLFTNIPKIWFHSVLLGSFICGVWGWGGDHSDKCL